MLLFLSNQKSVIHSFIQLRIAFDNKYCLEEIYFSIFDDEKTARQQIFIIYYTTTTSTATTTTTTIY